MVVIDGKQYSFTQPICYMCYTIRHPDVEPSRIREEYRETETCCICGNQTDEGIWYRIDPRTVWYPTEKVD